MEIIKKRTLDWWVFTLLPIIVFGIISFVLYLSESKNLILLFSQQLFYFSLILGSGEIGIRYVIGRETFQNIWQGIIILLFSSIFLSVTYINQNVVNNYGRIFLMFSILLSMGAVWWSNLNPHSGIPDKSPIEKGMSEIQKGVNKKIERKSPEFGGVKFDE